MDCSDLNWDGLVRLRMCELIDILRLNQVIISNLALVHPVICVGDELITV